MDNSPDYVGADPLDKKRRSKRLFLWLVLPASLICLGLGWQAYEHIQEARDRIT
ncbi:MAG TPA: hypothetical protein VGZ25_14070 [Gemmataceae bacterium]|nr:hypothetical protein [Gemmataceae bacterium]